MERRRRVSWLLAYGYLAYVFLGELPSVGASPYFSLDLISALLVVVYLIHSYLNWGWRTATKYLLVAAVISYLIEFLGVSTGIPFGRYYYDPSGLGPLLGPVPIFIPFFWAALGYFCISASDSYLEAAFLMVLLDISVDPILSQSLWHWYQLQSAGPVFYGVPVTNFVGWFLTSATFFAAFFLITHRRPLSSGSAIVFYFVFGVTNVLFDLSRGLVGVAVVALILFTVASSLLWAVNHRRSGRPERVVGVEDL